jgi:hypothetical protein
MLHSRRCYTLKFMIVAGLMVVLSIGNMRYHQYEQWLLKTLVLRMGSVENHDPLNTQAL